MSQQQQQQQSVRSIDSFAKMRLEVDYSRDNNSLSSLNSTTINTNNNKSKSFSMFTQSDFNRYKLRLRLVQESLISTNNNNINNNEWDLEVPLDVNMFVKLFGGQSWIGIVSSSLSFTEENNNNNNNNNNNEELPWRRQPTTTRFPVLLHNYTFTSSGNALSHLPVCTSFTSARFADTYLRMDQEVARIRMWLNIKLHVQLPAIVKVVFDSEIMRNYERLFSLILKVRR